MGGKLMDGEPVIYQDNTSTVSVVTKVFRIVYVKTRKNACRYSHRIHEWREVLQSSKSTAESPRTIIGTTGCVEQGNKIGRAKMATSE